MATATIGSKNPNPGMKLEIAYGMIGLMIAKPASAQAMRLMKPHSTRIIRGLGSSLKSAPFMPLDSEIAAKANTSKMASSVAMIIALGDMLNKSAPAVPVMATTISPNRTIKKYLLFTRLLAETGAA